MNKINFHKIRAVIRIALMILIVAGFGWHIWSLSAGFSFLEKIGWLIGMCGLGGLLIYVGSIPGVGAIPVIIDGKI